MGGGRGEERRYIRAGGGEFIGRRRRGGRGRGYMERRRRRVRGLHKGKFFHGGREGGNVVVRDNSIRFSLVVPLCLFRIVSKDVSGVFLKYSEIFWKI